MKKVLAMLMAALMVAAMFTGCGSKKAAESSDAIKIGMCGPLTGGAAVYGTAVQAGMEIAVEEVNAKGGLQFELKCQDDEHDTEKAANAYNALKGKGMQTPLILYLMDFSTRNASSKKPRYLFIV